MGILPTRIRYGIPAEMVELVSIPGVGAARAKKLWDHDLRTIKNVVDADQDLMFKIFNPSMAKKIVEAAKEI